MKILHLSTSDIEGGAARAAYRLHQGLRNIDVDSRMLVRAKDSVDKTVIAQQDILTKLGPLSNGLPLKLYRERERTMFSVQWFPDAILPQVRQLEPKIVHLHWICNGFCKIETLAKLNKPLVWTLHDMWALTGGCHYAKGCDRYTQSCGSCPQLNSNRAGDLSRWVWQRKAKAWQQLDLTIVSPSKWLAECVRKSSLLAHFRVEVIPHGLDLSKYKPVSRTFARQLLNLPEDKQLVLFGASPGTTGDERKGLQFLTPAIGKLRHSSPELELVIFGSAETKKTVEWGFPVHYLGQFHDDIALALVYSAADVMVVPSMQEAFGQTASESLACGTPVVAFDTTGLKDIVQHQHNGYLAKPFAVEDLAQGITWILAQGDRYQQLRINARETAEREFNLELQARRYLSLFQAICEKSVTRSTC